VSEQSIETRYKAYLTRLSKHEAIYACQKGGMVGAQALRDTLAGRGERREFLNDAWAKKIFGDTKLFESAGDGFYRLTDEAEEIDLGKRPTWKGQRPGEDWVRTAYLHIMDVVEELNPDVLMGARSCLGEEWEDTARACIRALDELKTRGVEKPLGKLWKVAWDESNAVSIITSIKAHQVALWLTTTMGDVDAFTRVRAYLREDSEAPRPWDVIGTEDGQVTAYVPMTVSASKNEAGELTPDDPDLSPRGILAGIHQRLVRRGIMKERA
jgi:hypothetical protein